MKTAKASLLRTNLTGWRTWATAGFSLAGWCFLAGGHWALASLAFCAATWLQILKK